MSTPVKNDLATACSTDGWRWALTMGRGDAAQICHLQFATVVRVPPQFGLTNRSVLCGTPWALVPSSFLLWRTLDFAPKQH